MKKYILPFVLLAIFACKEQKFSFPEFEEEISLNVTEIPLYETIKPDFLTISGDYLVVASSKTDPVLYIYETPELNCKKEFGYKGGGPEDIQSFAMFCESESDDLFLWGNTVLTIKRIFIDEKGEPLTKQVYLLKEYDHFNQMHIIRDSLLIYNEVPENGLLIKEVNLNTGNSKDFLKIKDKNAGPGNRNENRGYMAATSSHLVYGYLYNKQIDIYENKRKPKLINILKNNEKKQAISGLKSDEVVDHYIGIYAGKNCFYALYRGYNRREYQDGIAKKNILEVYNYNGQPLKKYILDEEIHIFTIDEKNNLLYGYNYQNEDVFLKYEL